MTFPLIDWAGARRLVDAGMECAGHSMTHPALAEQSAEAWHHELASSRQMLQDRLGRPVLHLAYPFGSVNDGVREAAARAGYASACTTVKALAKPGDDVLALPRVPVYGRDGLLDFVCRLRTAETSSQVLRRTLPARVLSLGRRLRGDRP